MNGDSIVKTLEFLEHEDPDIPKQVTNTMLYIAVRETYQTSKFQFAELGKEIDKVLEIAKCNERRITENEKKIEVSKAVNDVKSAQVQEKKDEKKEQKETVKSLFLSPFFTALMGGGVAGLLNILFGK